VLPPCAQASYEDIGPYQPGSQVTDHNAIDLDQAAIEAALAKTPVDYALAKAVYIEGGNSRSYSILTVPALASGYERGMTVAATGEDGDPTSAAVYEDAVQNATQISIYYEVSDVQEDHVRCRVGALPADLQMRDGCIDITQPVTIGNTEMTVRSHALCRARARTAFDLERASRAHLLCPYFSQATEIEHNNGRTIQGFSLQAQERMFECPINCPYPEYQSFYNYYGSHTYADDWVLGALDGTNVTYPTGLGGADFAAINDDNTRIEAIKKGTAYMNVWMYVIREFEDAIGDCTVGCIACNDDPVHAWDEGVAFYIGSNVQQQASRLATPCPFTRPPNHV
jgi:hypothetical protein